MIDKKFDLTSGDLPDTFHDVLQTVYRNIDDPNTESTAKRQITIKIEFTPSDDRSMAQTTVSIESKLAGPRKRVHAVYFGMDQETREHVGLWNDPRQMTLDEARPTPVPFKQGNGDA